MKQVININLSKDTPAATLADILKTKSDKQAKNKQPLYLFNEDIEKLNERYEQLFKKVKESTNLSEKQIEKECDILSQKYDFEIAELSTLRKIDYDIKQAEIKAREDELRPVRRGWWWRLIGRWVTNRAQDIIEERAELDAEEKHTAEEKQLDADWERLFPKKKKLSRREKRQLKKQQPAEYQEPETVKQSGIKEIERYLQELGDKVEAKPFAEVWDNIKDRIYPHKDEQKPAGSMEQATEPPEPPARKPRKNKQQLGV